MQHTPSEVGGSDARRTHGEEVSLSELMIVLSRYWLLVLGIAIAAGAVAFLISSNRTPVYQASSKLLINPPKAADGSSARISAATFPALISNQALILEALNDLRLTEPPHHLTAADALQRHVSVQTLAPSEIILITARLGDAALAAQFANRLAERSVQLAQQVAQEDLVAARDTLKERLDESHKRVEEAEQRLLTYRKKAQFEALTAEVGALVEERAKLLPLLVQIEAERARIRHMTDELARPEANRHPQRLATPAVADRESAAPSDSRIPRRDNPDALGDPLHETLLEQLSASRMKLSELESQRAEIMRATDLTKAGARKLNELYTSEVELDRLYREASLARETYGDLAEEYEQTRTQLVGRSSQVQIVDYAVPPSRPLSPRPFRDTAVGVLVAAVLASAVVLLYSAVTGTMAVAR